MSKETTDQDLSRLKKQADLYRQCKEGLENASILLQNKIDNIEHIFEDSQIEEIDPDFRNLSEEQKTLYFNEVLTILSIIQTEANELHAHYKKLKALVS